jgi:hypothetical protein
MKPVALDKWAVEISPLNVTVTREGTQVCDLAQRKLQKFRFMLEIGRIAYARKEETKLLLNNVRREILHFLFGDIKWKVRDLYSMYMSNAPRQEILDKFNEILKEMSYD